jgi:hypothetical protein
MMDGDDGERETVTLPLLLTSISNTLMSLTMLK